MNKKKSYSIEEIAQATHEVNRVYCLALGDPSQVPWDEAPAWQRESAIAGVQSTIDGSAKTPEEQHELWAEHKRADGWVHGDVKDAEARTHPCLVPYDQLPSEQQAKDSIFRAVVMGLRDRQGEEPQ